jgi:hypothetical protein
MDTYNLTLTNILVLFIIHFFGDYIGQTKRNMDHLYKSKQALLNHCAFYSLCFVFLYPLQLTFHQLFIFIIITFLSHFLFDFYASKIRFHYFVNQDLKLTNMACALDLVAHYIQIILTFIFVKLYF